jgi:hypothetical protein
MIFEASGDRDEIPPYVDIHRCLKRGEAIAICKDALAAHGPLNTRQLALKVMAAKGLNTGDNVLRSSGRLGRRLSQANAPCKTSPRLPRPTCGRPERGSGSLQDGKGGNAVTWRIRYLHIEYAIYPATCQHQSCHICYLFAEISMEIALWDMPKPKGNGLKGRLAISRRS